MPNVVQVAIDCESFGAQGITVHPRPDERHIRYKDVYDLREIVTTEFNIEGNPTEKKFVELVLANKPTQVTLVPDALNAITSNAGWDTIAHQERLKDLVATFKEAGCRVSIFVDPIEKMVEAAATTGTDRIELYTERFAHDFYINREEAVKDYAKAAQIAAQVGLGVNAGHDLNLDNLKFLKERLPNLLEVSIGHALICDALYYGLENTIQLYLRELA